MPAQAPTRATLVCARIFKPGQASRRSNTLPHAPHQPVRHPTPLHTCASLAVDTCYDVYLDPLTHAIIPAYQPLPTGAIRQDAKKGDEGARPAKGGAARKGAPSPHAI